MLRLPFIAKASTAIHLTEDAVYMVSLSRLGSRLWVTACDREGVVDDDPNGALQRVLSRSCTRNASVAVCLGEGYVRSIIEPADPHDEEWDKRMLRRLVPSGSDPEAFVVRTSVTAADDANGVALVACTPLPAVADIVRRLSELGYHVVSVSAAEANVGHAFSFEPGFVDGDAVIILRSPSEDLHLSYREGRLRELGRRHLSDRESFDRARLQVAVRYATNADSQSASPREGSSFLPLAVPGAPIDLEYAPVVGLAIAQLFPSLPSVNFLDDAAVVAAHNATDRRDALRLMLGVFGLLLVLLLMTSATTAFLERRLGESSTTARTAIEGRQRAEQARLALTQSADRLASVQVRLDARTDAAGMLERIGRSVPPGVTFEKLDATAGLDGKWVVVIRAKTGTDENVALFSEQLSTIAGMKEVELRFVRSGAGMTRGPADASTFEIQGEYVSGAQAGGAL